MSTEQPNYYTPWELQKRETLDKVATFWEIKTQHEKQYHSKYIRLMQNGTYTVGEDIARRIVDCVNFLDGIPTERLDKTRDCIALFLEWMKSANDTVMAMLIDEMEEIVGCVRHEKKYTSRSDLIKLLYTMVEEDIIIKSRNPGIERTVWKWVSNNTWDDIQEILRNELRRKEKPDPLQQTGNDSEM